jgi:hypothetical protein
VMTAAAQGAVEGAVVTAAGSTDEVEAEISVEAAGGQQQRYFRQIDECSSVVAVAAQDAVDETAVGGRCRWSSGEEIQWRCSRCNSRWKMQVALQVDE